MITDSLDNYTFNGRVSIPEIKYSTIMLDPPWPIEWRPNKFNGFKQLGYPTMLIAEICSIPIWDLIDIKNGAKILLWTTNQFLPEAISVVQKAWRLHYSKLFTYIKPGNIGRPPYNSTEHCVIAYAGHPKNPRKKESVPNHYTHDARIQHSRKPDEIYSIFETFTESPRLELFARRERKGWDCLGNQLSYV